jgi:hypothetical protein
MGRRRRTRVESLPAEGANHVFANASASGSLYSYLEDLVVLCALIDAGSVLVRRREPEQLSKTRLVRFARRTIPIGLNPFWMLDAQGVVYLSLKFNVGADLIRPARKSLCFHLSKGRFKWKPRHFAYAGFSTATSGVIRNLSFEGAN